MAIRSYGPGKFIKLIDSYAYELALDGVSEEVSYPDGGGWYGLVRFEHPDPRSRDSDRERIRKFAAEEKDQLTAEEEELLDESVAIIFYERSDGIVETDWFDDESKAEETWDEIEAEVEGGDDEEEDDEEEETD